MPLPRKKLSNHIPLRRNLHLSGLQPTASEMAMVKTMRATAMGQLTPAQMESIGGNRASDNPKLRRQLLAKIADDDPELIARALNTTYLDKKISLFSRRSEARANLKKLIRSTNLEDRVYHLMLLGRNGYVRDMLPVLAVFANPEKTPEVSIRIHALTVISHLKYDSPKEKGKLVQVLAESADPRLEPNAGVRAHAITLLCNPKWLKEKIVLNLFHLERRYFPGINLELRRRYFEFFAEHGRVESLKEIMEDMNHVELPKDLKQKPAAQRALNEGIRAVTSIVRRTSQHKVMIASLVRFFSYVLTKKNEYRPRARLVAVHALAALATPHALELLRANLDSRVEPKKAVREAIEQLLALTSV